LTSATHGVEGFCGSGCQAALLRDDAFVAAVERSGVEVMMLHALNPYGFSHLRRANEDNADLNRNFVDFSTPPATSGAYAEIHPLLLPPSWPPPPESEQKMGAWISTHGEKAFQAAVSGGQYTYPLEHTLQALRAEAWLRNHPDVPATQHESIKRAFRDSFYLDADDWKETVCEQAKAACLKALAALAPVAVHT